MKKTLTYISVLSILAAVSCSKNVEFDGGEYALTFEALTTEMETRAGEGEDFYHENDITTMDWFFFADEEGTQLRHLFQTEGKTLKVTEAQITEFGLSGKSYLYAVANAPEAVRSKTTLADIKTVPVTTNFATSAGKLDVDNLSFVMDTYDKESGKYLMEISPKQAADGVASSKQPKITVPLSRLAVKFTTTVKVKSEVTVTDSFGLEEHWTPILNKDDFDVYMMNALKAATLSGTPVRRADEGVNQGNYFNYARDLTEVADLSEYGDDGKLSGEYYVWQTVDPFYTYPQKWNDVDNNEPYIKIIFPWVSDIKGNSEFHYKVVLPKPANNVFTLDRNCWYNLTATIEVLGGTENDYVLIDQVEVSVADWAEPSWLAGKGLNSAKYFYVPTKEFDVYSMDSFNIPINTNSSAKAYITKIEFKDYSKSPTLNLVYNFPTTTGTTSVANTSLQRDNSSPRQTYDNYQKEHTYSVSVNSTDRYNKFVTFSHSLENIYVQRDITIYIEHSERSDWHETVIIHQHPAIELKKAVDDEGNLIAGDLFVNGRFASVTNAKFGATDRGYYHSRNGWTGFGDRWGGTYDYYGILSNAINPTLTSTNIYGALVHQADVDWVDSPFFITDITVSAFSESNNFYKMSVNGAPEETVYYKIGDPRVKVSSIFTAGASAPFNQTWSLQPYLYDEQRVNQYSNSYTDLVSEWDNPGDILVAANDINTRNMIAPHILVSSGLTEGVQGYSPDDFVSYFKRGATYQEAGYPAGRWRLPTEAEIAFIAARQYDGTIPKIFNESVPYFASSGRFVVIPRDRTKPMEYYTYDQLDTNFYYVDEDGRQYGPYPYRNLIDAKFIYDAWYWGLEPMSANEYHANGHIENNE